MDADPGDPVEWIRERLGGVVWSRQAEVARAVRDHPRVAVQAANSVSKSHGAARLAAWWVDSHPVGEAFVLTTAPTQRQVDVILWGELRRAHRAGGLPGEIGKSSQWTMGDDVVALGWKSADAANADEAAAAFQGIHARFLLVIIDEAAGVPAWLWEAVESMAISEHSRVLAIGNPTDPESTFAEACAPDSGWHTISISAFDCPAFTGEDVPAEVAEQLANPSSVARMAKRWGENSGRYTARVLGQFPDDAEDALIARSWIRAAQGRDLATRLGSSGTQAWDVARLGGDESVGYENRGGVVRRIYRGQRQELMATTGAIVRLRRDARGRPDVVVDVGGLGAGVVDRLREQGVAVVAFNGAERAVRPDRFVNRRAEVYWALREAFAAGEIDLDPADEELAVQLAAVRFFEDSRGRIQIESKDSMRRRGVPSPDRADAVSMSVATSRWRVPRVLSAAEELGRVRAEIELAREAARRRRDLGMDLVDLPADGSLTGDLMGRDW